MLKSIILGLILSLPFAAIESSQFNESEVKHQLDPESLKCLTENIFYEAGNQSIEGKIAVAYVTWNRTQHERFPNSICSVVHQKNQFSWVSNRVYQKTQFRNDWRWKESQIVARNFQAYPDPTSGALFFHERSVRPNWNYRQVARIQNHIFYELNEN